MAEEAELDDDAQDPSAAARKSSILSGGGQGSSTALVTQALSKYHLAGSARSFLITVDSEGACGSALTR